jgi:hypothetical protein
MSATAMKKTPAKPFSRFTRGQSLVELGLTLVLILTLLAGAVDLGSAFFDYIALRDAAQEGALYGSIHPTDTPGIIARIRKSSTAPVNFDNDPNVNIPQPIITGAACAGGAIKVTVSYIYHLTMPFIGGILGTQTITLSADVTDTILTPKCP